MRTIRGQIIATTGIDSQGGTMDKDELFHLFEQAPDPWVMCVEHDISAIPVARAFNKRFQQLGEGAWAIVCDVEVFDEKRLSKFDGVSISFMTDCYTLFPNRSPEIELFVNPRLVSPSHFYDLVGESTEDLQLDVRTLVNKSLDAAAILVIGFSAGAVFSGFFNAAGADLYAALRRRISDFGASMKAEKGVQLRCNMTFHIGHCGRRAEVCVSVSSADLDALAASGITVEPIIAHVQEIAGDRKLRKVVARLNAAGPLVVIDYYVDEDHNVITLANQDTPENRSNIRKDREVNISDLYAILSAVARDKSQLTYGQLSQRYFERTEDWHEPHGSWDTPLGELNRSLHAVDLPPLSAVVVLQESREPGGLFWGSSPNVPAKPKDEMARIGLYGEILHRVHEAAWPEAMPVST